MSIAAFTTTAFTAAEKTRLTKRGREVADWIESATTLHAGNATSNVGRYIRAALSINGYRAIEEGLAYWDALPLRRRQYIVHCAKTNRELKRQAYRGSGSSSEMQYYLDRSPRRGHLRVVK